MAITNFQKDRRSKLWAKLESKIRRGAQKKDKKFILRGSWKRFAGKQDGFLVYAVDGEWIRNNLSVIFGMGGHGYVHEFIPNNEIWVATHHLDGDKASQQYFDSTVIHEIVECEEMKKGRIFWKAHQVAIRAEKEAGLLKNLHRDFD